MKLFYIIFLTTLALVDFTSCRDFLDKKPDKTLEIPSTLGDFQALLDDVGTMNLGYSSLGDISSDDYYLSDADYESLSNEDEKNAYIWEKSVPSNDNDWFIAYRIVFNSNLILSNLNAVHPDLSQQQSWNNIKGGALYFRAFSFYSLVEIFAQPFINNSTESALGIPLPMSPDPNQGIKRASLKDSYNQIINDAKASISLLPILSKYKTRPNKAAAYGLLARIYLSINDYTNAGVYSDSSLQLSSTLMDFNDLDSGSDNPIQLFNDEIIFFATDGGGQCLLPSRCKIDTSLYNLYNQGDLRKVIFFKANTNGSYSFKGNYSGDNTNGYGFYGIATDEIYLIRAECSAREGKIDAAMNDLNKLLAKRWRINEFVPFGATNEQEALSLILKERRKELIFRDLRWDDLRRLNPDPNMDITLKRVINGMTFTLSPGDPKYTFQIPPQVISFNNIQQNDR